MRKESAWKYFGTPKSARPFSTKTDGEMSGRDFRTARKCWRRTFAPYDGDRPQPPIAISLQAPFRAGIRLDAYQLLPLRKALRLPRVNLLIADDVGLGKTVEAGLVARELLLRRRIDFIVIAAPAGDDDPVEG